MGTAGCTAMPFEAMEEVITWLEQKAEPRLIQLPRATYSTLAAQQAWPELE